MSDENTENKDSGSEKVEKQVSDEDFARVRYLYETDQGSLSELADEVGITRQALSKRFKNNGVTKGSRVEELEKQRKKDEDRYSKKRSDWIEETRTNGYNALKQSQMIARKIVADALKATKPLAEIDDNLKAAQRFNKILCDNIAATLSLLDADDHINEDDLPMLIIEDLTDEEILEHHINTGALPEDATLDDIISEGMGSEQI